MVRLRLTFRRGIRYPVMRRSRYADSIRIRNIVPLKPRKPPSAYNLFYKKYYWKLLSRSATVAETNTRAGIFWQSHPILRQQYEARARPEQNRYKAAYSDYLKKKDLLKHPGHAYSYFVRHFWQREGRGKSITEIGKLAGMAWRGMSPEERRPFQEQATQAKETYDRMIQEVNAGRARLEEFIRSPAQEAGAATRAGNVTGENVQSQA